MTIMMYINRRKNMAKKLKKPYSLRERCDFVVEYNHKKGMRIEETDDYLFALEENEIMDNNVPVIDPDYEEKQKQKERENLNQLTITNEELRYALSLKSVKLEDIVTLPKVNSIILIPPVFKRDDTIIEELGNVLGYTVQDLDFLFKYKVLPY